MAGDAVDRILAQWQKVRPDLDVRPMGVVGRLGRVARLLERRVEEGLGAFDLTVADFDVLATLRRAGPPHRLTPTQLYRALMITSGTMTSRIDKLERRGLVARQEDPSDRRGTLVALTPEGRRLVDRAVEAHLVNEAKLLSALSRTEQTALDGLLRKLLGGLEGEGDE
jgi:DNA-binding MarR family transcriptional regulator